MQAYTIIGITMGGDAPFIHKDKVYTEWLDCEKEIYEITSSMLPVNQMLEAMRDGKFWIEDTFYKVHTVEIILDKGLTPNP